MPRSSRGAPQAGLALIGHTALLIAGALLSLSNGWNVRMAIESATLSSANRVHIESASSSSSSGRVPYDMRPTRGGSLSAGSGRSACSRPTFQSMRRSRRACPSIRARACSPVGWSASPSPRSLATARFWSLSPAFYDGGFMWVERSAPEVAERPAARRETRVPE